MSPKTRPKSFGTFEKRATGNLCIEDGARAVFILMHLMDLLYETTMLNATKFTLWRKLAERSLLHLIVSSIHASFMLRQLVLILYPERLVNNDYFVAQMM